MVTDRAFRLCPLMLQKSTVRSLGPNCWHAGRERHDCRGNAVDGDFPMDAGGRTHTRVNYGNAVACPGKPAPNVGTIVGTAASIGQEVQCLRA